MAAGCRRRGKGRRGHVGLATGRRCPPGPLGWLADRSHPLTLQTHQLGGEGLGLTQAEAEAVAVVTQTCDIVRTCWSEGGDGLPFVQVCPVVALVGADLTEAAGGHSSRFAPLPALGHDHFADLLVCSTLEKTVLLGLEGPISGCGSDEDREKFAAAVDRNRRRFAFPDGMDQVLNPLRRRFRDKWKKDSAEGRRIAEVWEIRARRADHTPWYGEDQVEVELTFVIAPDALRCFQEEEAISLHRPKSRRGRRRMTALPSWLGSWSPSGIRPIGPISGNSWSLPG